MTNMTNQLAIYLIVGLNVACHILLIWKLKMDKGARLKYCALSIGVPLVVMMTMRLMVALGAVHGRVAEQGGIEHAFTMLASMLLVAGPFLVTGAALVFSRKQRNSAGEALAA
jgi:hypothetical protein